MIKKSLSWFYQENQLIMFCLYNKFKPQIKNLKLILFKKIPVSLYLKQVNFETVSPNSKQKKSVKTLWNLNVDWTDIWEFTTIYNIVEVRLINEQTTAGKFFSTWNGIEKTYG